MNQILFSNRSPINEEDVQKQFSLNYGETNVAFLQLLNGQLIICAETAAERKVLHEMENVRYFRCEKSPFKYVLIRTMTETIIIQTRPDDFKILWQIESDADRIGDNLYLAMLPEGAQIFSTEYRKSYLFPKSIWVWHKDNVFYSVKETSKGLRLQALRLQKGYSEVIWESEPYPDVKLDYLKVGKTNLAMVVKLCSNEGNRLVFIFNMENGSETGFVDNVIDVREFSGDLVIRSIRRNSIVY